MRNFNPFVYLIATPPTNTRVLPAVRPELQEDQECLLSCFFSISFSLPRLPSLPPSHPSFLPYSFLSSSLGPFLPWSVPTFSQLFLSFLPSFFLPSIFLHLFLLHTSLRQGLLWDAAHQGRSPVAPPHTLPPPPPLNQVR